MIAIGKKGPPNLNSEFYFWTEAKFSPSYTTNFTWFYKPICADISEVTYIMDKIFQKKYGI